MRHGRVTISQADRRGLVYCGKQRLTGQVVSSKTSRPTTGVNWDNLGDVYRGCITAQKPIKSRTKWETLPASARLRTSLASLLGTTSGRPAVFGAAVLSAALTPSWSDYSGVRAAFILLVLTSIFAIGPVSFISYAARTSEVCRLLKRHDGHKDHSCWSGCNAYCGRNDSSTPLIRSLSERRYRWYAAVGRSALNG